VAKDPDEGKENPNEGKPLTTPLAARLLDRLVGELAAEGGLTPEWRETFWPYPAISSYLTLSGNTIRPSTVRTT
jgi:hypothetical protein